MTSSYVALGCAIVLGVVGQLLLKAGAGADSLVDQLVALPSILGLAFYAAAALCYMFALREIPVSVAFPSVSLSYALVVGAAYLFRDEPLGWMNIAGVVLISAGVLLVASQK